MWPWGRYAKPWPGRSTNGNGSLTCAEFSKGLVQWRMYDAAMQASNSDALKERFAELKRQREMQRERMKRSVIQRIKNRTAAMAWQACAVGAATRTGWFARASPERTRNGTSVRWRRGHSAPP